MCYLDLPSWIPILNFSFSWVEANLFIAIKMLAEFSIFITCPLKFFSIFCNGDRLISFQDFFFASEIVYDGKNILYVNGFRRNFEYAVHIFANSCWKFKSIAIFRVSFIEFNLKCHVFTPHTFPDYYPRRGLWLRKNDLLTTPVIWKRIQKGLENIQIRHVFLTQSTMCYDFHIWGAMCWGVGSLREDINNFSA